MQHNELILTPHGDSSWRIVSDHTITIADGMSISIPRGFVTDFASIPPILHWFMVPNSKQIRRAALMHDWLYATHRGFTRGTIDKLFERVSREDGMSRFKAKLCFWIVSIFGKSHYIQGPDRLREITPSLEKFIGSTPSVEGS